MWAFLRCLPGGHNWIDKYKSLKYWNKLIMITIKKEFILKTNKQTKKWVLRLSMSLAGEAVTSTGAGCYGCWTGVGFSLHSKNHDNQWMFLKTEY